MIQLFAGIYLFLILASIVCLMVGISADASQQSKIAEFCGKSLVLLITAKVIYTVFLFLFGIIYFFIK
ncbi:hypothetical protein QV06_00925 [Gallibacterium genomosp. 3]|uniref:Uncharacterized protein n=1 Tax=Gallibacterium genomosp. 3 TaxID=505345 RepID=A0A1A7PT80_9PAST|nr:hypothetical protein [Gallibacterium genomosp. 3]OBX05783.1 hypothetical protein QV06_00925 [Gallibacterium genomosp. 3]